MENKLSRRTFVKGAAASVLGLAATGVLGACASTQPEASAAPTPTPTPTSTPAPAPSATPAGGAAESALPQWAPAKWDYEADVVICGCGIAGLMGAREATRQGHSCLVLEKASKAMAGGSSACFGGFYVPSQPNVLVWGSNGRLSEAEAGAIAAQTVEDYTWMSYNGMTVNSFYQVEGRGPGFYRVVEAALDGMGTNVLYETAAEDLIADPYTGEVFGVKARTADGKELCVKANKGVLLATGGASGNQQLLNDLFVPEGVELLNCSTPDNTGEGLLMGIKAGAAVHNMTQHGVELQPFSLKKASQEVGTAVMLQAISENRGARLFVDQSGKRFMNEESDPTHYKGLLAWADFPGAPHLGGYQGWVHMPFYMIFDEQMFRSERIGGHDGNGWASAKGIFAWSADNQAELEKGWLVKGDTIEELVRNLAESSGHDPIDPQALKDTLAAFNADSAAGKDSFGRSVTKPIDQGPYYAVELTGTLMYTIGGLTSNGVGATLRWDGTHIPGLYSAGDVGQPTVTNPLGACGCGAMGALAVRDMLAQPDRQVIGQADAVIAQPTAEAIAIAESGLYAGAGGGSQSSQEEAGNSVVSDAVYKDGTYTGVGNSTIGGDIHVTVTVADGKVAGVQVDSHNETASIGGMAMDTLAGQAVAANGYQLDGVSGATETAKGFAAAVMDALSKAK